MYSQEYLKQCFEYRDGHLFWKERPREHFNTSLIGMYWNERHAGSLAGGSEDACENLTYLQITVDGKKVTAHSIVWILHNGAIPYRMQVDHVNGCRRDNRIENLRVVTRSQNQRNRRRDSKNKSGITGVDFMARTQRWRAQAYDLNGIRVYLGAHRTLLDAAAARKAAEIKFEYHENHGRENPEVEMLRRNQRP